MVKCEKCGNIQPGDKIDICRHNGCGYVCHPIATVRSDRPSKKKETKETIVPFEDEERQWQRQD